MSNDAPPEPLLLAQVSIQPQLPGAMAPAIAPQLPGAAAPAIAPQLPGAGTPTIAPMLPGSVSPVLPGSATPVSAATSSSQAGSSNLNITISNPDNLPSLPPGDHELKLVIQQDASVATPAPSGGIGSWEIFLAVVAALLVAPFVRREAGKLGTNLHALEFVKKNGIAVSSYLIFFSMGWVLFMIILPQVNMLDFSFRYNLPPHEVGGVNDVHTLKNYTYLVFGREGSSDWLNWLHLKVFAKTIVASILVTLINFAMCYPLAYFMAHAAKGGNQRLLFLCLLLPFWVNEILRAFAFKLIFADQGLLNVFLMGIGLFDTPFDFFRSDVALYTGLTYAYLLLMIFPLYNAIESLDYSQVEAARDLGASVAKIHLRVVIPHAKPGIASGCTMVFMLSAGALAAPNILGGPSSLWFTQIIYQWYNTGGNWPQGAAYAFVLLLACIIFVQIMMRVFKVSLGEIAQR